MCLTKCHGLALLFLCLYCPSLLIAQIIDTIPIPAKINYNTPKSYEIGGIKIKGTVLSDKAALLSIAGLKIGDKIEIPGAQITNALKTIWKLGLFEDVQIYQEKAIGEIVYLAIEVEEINRLGSIKIHGVKKSKVETIKGILLQHLRIGRKLTATFKNNAINALRQHYEAEGFPDILINCIEKKEPSIRTKLANLEKDIQLIFTIDKKEKVKVATIDFIGNDKINDKKLTKLLGIKTKRKLFTSSKLIIKELIVGKKSIITYYNTLGYLDATISKDTVWRQAAGNWQIQITIQEGNLYYFGNINWRGNSIYPTQRLATILGIEKGTVFNPEHLQSRLQFSLDGTDVSGLYMDNGYLFFRAEAIQKTLREDTIDIDIHILEGTQAIIDKVIIRGNSKTHEHVIRRELRTKPDKKFSRFDIIRSQRALMNLGYFNPESMDVKTPVDPANGTVDIEYVLEEKNSDQFELSGGWGGSTIGLTGTVGITFNNFSLREFLMPNLWDPLPQGDGQRTSIRFQSNGKAYQSLNLSFTEPWLGGKRPNSLTTGFFYTRYFDETNSIGGVNSLFNIFGANISLGRRLRFPDDNIIATTQVGYQRYRLNNWTSGLFITDGGEVITEGIYNNLSLTQTFARSTINHSIFPTDGSKFSLSLQLTAPYSLFNQKDYTDLNSTERYQWLEYHKWRFNAEWYTSLVGKLVLKTSAKLGFVGSYNSQIGISPFERFQLGGDGLSNVQRGFRGTDIISLRGYEISDLENNVVNGTTVATPIFNKFTMELRYPLSTNPNATIYGLAFLEAGNAYQFFRDYNPFDVKRSIGFGIRAHLPMFGTLGFDYGLGFDKAGARTWQNFGKISVILGFEPE